MLNTKTYVSCDGLTKTQSKNRLVQLTNITNILKA